MPVAKDEFMRGRKATELERAVVVFLQSNPGLAYTQAEVQSVVLQPTQNFLQDLANWLGVGTVLNTLVREGRVLKKQVSLVDHYMWKPGAR